MSHGFGVGGQSPLGGLAERQAHLWGGNAELERSFRTEDLDEVLLSMKEGTAPGPDGPLKFFLQKVLADS
jgi:hypothetical protein